MAEHKCEFRPTDMGCLEALLFCVAITLFSICSTVEGIKHRLDNDPPAVTETVEPGEQKWLDQKPSE